MRGGLVVAIAVSLVAGHARAQPGEQSAAADQLFQRGRELIKQNRWFEACAKFEDSLRYEVAVGTQLNLAECYGHVGKVASAWRLYKASLATADKADIQRREFAQRRAAALESRLSTLAIVVPVEHPAGLIVMRDGVPVDPEQWNTALPIDGGTYTITAHTPGAIQWSTEITVAAEHDTTRVEIPDLRDPPRDTGKPTAPAAPGRAAQPSSPSSASSHASSIALPLVVGAGAVALLGAGLAFERSARSQYDEAARNTDESLRRTMWESANSKYHDAQMLAVSGLAAGGVAVWLYLRGRSRDRGAETSPSAYVVPSAAGLAVLGQF